MFGICYQERCTSRDQVLKAGYYAQPKSKPNLFCLGGGDLPVLPPLLVLCANLHKTDIKNSGGVRMLWPLASWVVICSGHEAGSDIPAFFFLLLFFFYALEDGSVHIPLHVCVTLDNINQKRNNNCKIGWKIFHPWQSWLQLKKVYRMISMMTLFI